MKDDCEKLVLQGAVQLHPETCASSIRWSVVAKETRFVDRKTQEESYTRNLDCTMHLTDCGKQITWSGGTYDGGAAAMIAKLDNALAELRDMRRCIKTAEKFYNRLRHGAEDE